MEWITRGLNLNPEKLHGRGQFTCLVPIFYKSTDLKLCRRIT